MVAKKSRTAWEQGHAGLGSSRELTVIPNVPSQGSRSGFAHASPGNRPVADRRRERREIP